MRRGESVGTFAGSKREGAVPTAAPRWDGCLLSSQIRPGPLRGESHGATKPDNGDQHTHTHTDESVSVCVFSAHLLTTFIQLNIMLTVLACAANVEVGF